MMRAAWRYGLLALALGALAGCGVTGQGNLVRAGVQTYGAQAYDKGLENATWFMCQAASVGSIVRKYGSDKEKAAAWRELCRGTAAGSLLAPPGGDE